MIEVHQAAAIGRSETSSHYSNCVLIVARMGRARDRFMGHIRLHQGLRMAQFGHFLDFPKKLKQRLFQKFLKQPPKFQRLFQKFLKQPPNPKNAKFTKFDQCHPKCAPNCAKACHFWAIGKGPAPPQTMFLALGPWAEDVSQGPPLG